MFIRPFAQHDLARLTELTIETFGPFYEDSFRPLVGELIFANQHGNWRSTGGDPFHAPARALYERLGCTKLPVAVYYRQL